MKTEGKQVFMGVGDLVTITDNLYQCRFIITQTYAVFCKTPPSFRPSLRVIENE